MSDTQNTNGDTPMHTPISYSEMHHSHLGPILGVLIIMLVLILSGLYIWGGMLNEEAEREAPNTLINNEPETPRANVDTQILDTTSPSDELDAIEADISNTNIDSLDTDLTAIDVELGIPVSQ